MSTIEGKTVKNALKNASTKQLEQEVARRRQLELKNLETERSILDAKIQSLGGSTIETTNGNAEPRTKTIRKSMHKITTTNSISEKSLKERLVDIASDGQPRTALEFIEVLTKLGWKTSSNKPYYVVAAALASQERKNVFRRVSKGVYSLVKTQ